VKRLESKRVLKWKDGKVFWGEKKATVTYSSRDEYVILTKERRVKNRMACHS